jgi:hypothetical protein
VRRVPIPTLESLFVATFALLGFRLGTVPIRDNSAFVHLRTGIDMANGLGIPRADPYSFTAAGEPWVVQSWLAELTYGWLHRLGGIGLVVLQQGVLIAVLAWLVARLGRAGTPLRTAVAAGVAIAIGARYWTPRPLLFGLIGLAVLVTIVERRHRVWWLVPVAWLWANSHGSFALGVAWLVLRAIGEAIDARDRRAASNTGRYAVVFVVGLLASVVNPLGPRLLAFVATVVDKREALQDVVEWRSPAFTGTAALVSLAGLVLLAGIVMRRGALMADVLPIAAFVAAGLVAQRNLAAAGVVAAPALARALTTKRRPDAERPRVHLAFVAVLVVAAGVFAIDGLRDDDVNARAYPVAATEWLEERGLRAPDVRLAHQDYVGGWLILRDGRGARVFMDDRVDMYPSDVSRDYIGLLRARTGTLATLDKWRIDAVLWERESALSTVLRASPRWRRAYADDDWLVFLRR